MKKLLLFAIISFIMKLNGQTQAYLDLNNVKALVHNRNDMFWDLSTNARYEVPKYSGKNCNFANSVWIGGIEPGGQLHMAGMTYRQSGVDFWPGPLDTVSGNIDAPTSAAYNKIWKVSYTDINAFILAWNTGSIIANTYTPTIDILTWPAQGNGNYARYLAPFVDVNGDGIYNPMTGGDYPKIKGDQMLFYVCNDKMNVHTETMGVPLGIEMQVSAYSYGCPAVLTAYPELNYTTFYNYKIINRSSSQYNKTVAAIWCDADLGQYSDDYIGCDTLNNLGYMFNSTSSDGVYGNYPPILSYQILKGPPADINDGIDNDRDGLTDEPLEETKFNDFTFYNNNIGPFNPATTNPATTIHYYNYMNAFWKDGSPFRGDSAGYLYGNGAPTKYVYPGNPQVNTGWTEMFRNNPAGDRRFIIGNGPFTFKPGDSFELDFSILTTFDSTANGYKNITKVKNQNFVLRNFYNLISKPTCLNEINGIKENGINKINLAIVPNPASEFVYISSVTDLTGAELKLYNSMGQQVFNDKLSSSLYKLDLSDFAAGVYFIEIKGRTATGRSKVIKN
jgi:hypothetical protein